MSFNNYFKYFEFSVSAVENEITNDCLNSMFPGSETESEMLFDTQQQSIETETHHQYKQISEETCHGSFNQSESSISNTSQTYTPPKYEITTPFNQSHQNVLPSLKFTEEQLIEASFLLKKLSPFYKPFDQQQFTLSLNLFVQKYQLKYQEIALIEKIAHAMNTFPIFFQEHGIGINCLESYVIMTLKGIYSPSDYHSEYQLQPFIDLKQKMVLSVYKQFNGEYVFMPPNSIVNVVVRTKEEHRQMLKYLESKPKMIPREYVCGKKTIHHENKVIIGSANDGRNTKAMKAKGNGLKVGMQVFHQQNALKL